LTQCYPAKLARLCRRRTRHRTRGILIISTENIGIRTYT
jgi:hypothetical protein